MSAHRYQFRVAALVLFSSVVLQLLLPFPQTADSLLLFPFAFVHFGVRCPNPKMRLPEF